MKRFAKNIKKHLKQDSMPEKKFICATIVAFLMIQMCMVSCTSVTKERQDIVGMEEVEECVIPLDSLTTQHPAYLQLMNDSTICFYNRATHNLCFVNLNTHTIYKKIQLYREGPNAILWLDAFYNDNDSIWVYEARNQTLTIVDTLGTILDKISIPTTDESGNPLRHAVLPYPMTVSPYVIKDGVHIMQGMAGFREEGQMYGSTLLYEPKSGKVMTDNAYPEVYGSDEDLTYWEPFAYRITTYTFMPDGNMLINYPVSDSLYVYDYAAHQRKPVYAGYSSPTNIKQKRAKTREGIKEDVLSQYRYIGIFYDKSRNVYYRLLRLPSETVNPENNRLVFFQQPVAVIILDSDLNIIGESILPTGTYTVESFVNSDGLHINVESDDDDMMVYRVFRLTEK